MGDIDYKVKSGDCAWNVSKQHLKTKVNQSVSTQMIVKEMNRLSNVNDCNSVDEFSAKYFSKIGTILKLEKKQEITQKERPNFGKFDIYENVDSLYEYKRDSIRDYKPDVMKDTIIQNTILIPDSTSVKEKKNDAVPIQAPATEMDYINSIADDKDKIIEYNKTHAKGNYAIIDKTACKVTVHDRNGEVLNTFSVGVGKKKGDKMNSSLRNKQWVEDGAFTTPGQFTLGKSAMTKHNKHGYQSDKTNELNVYTLNGVQHDEYYSENVSLAIHQVPKYRRDERNHLLQDDKTTNNISNNRMSFGCVNMLDDDFEKIKEYIGSGSSLYILPEEKGNKLELTEMPNGEVAFGVKYNNEKDQATADEATNKFYSKRPKVLNNSRADAPFLAESKNKMNVLKPSI